MMFVNEDEHFLDDENFKVIRRFGDRLESRLYNMKFNSALMYALEDAENTATPIDQKPSQREMNIFRFLADEYDNCGWQSGRIHDRIIEKLKELYSERVEKLEEEPIEEQTFNPRPKM